MTRPVLGIVLLALAFRAFLLLGAGGDSRYALMSDSYSYLRPAQTLRETGRYAVRDGAVETPETYRTPGYPLFLIPFLDATNQPHHRRIQWIQVLLGALSAGFLAWAALEFWGSRTPALLAGGAFALDYVHAIHSLFILSDVLFVLFLSMLVFALTRRSYAWAGALSACAALIRPVGVYLPFVVGLALLVPTARSRGPVLRTVVLYLSCALLPLVAWTARNHAVMGRWTFSSFQDANLYLVRAALVESQEKNLSYPDAIASIEQQRKLASVPDNVWATSYLLHHVPAYLRLMAKDAVKLFSGNSMKIAAWIFARDESYGPQAVAVHGEGSPIAQANELLHRHIGVGLLMIVYGAFLGLVYLLCLRGIWESGTGKGWGITLLFLSIPLYFTAVTLGSGAQARYRLPIMPALFLFAGGGVKIAAVKEPK